MPKRQSATMLIAEARWLVACDDHFSTRVFLGLSTLPHAIEAIIDFWTTPVRRRYYWYAAFITLSASAHHINNEAMSSEYGMTRISLWPWFDINAARAGIIAGGLWWYLLLPGMSVFNCRYYSHAFRVSHLPCECHDYQGMIPEDNFTLTQHDYASPRRKTTLLALILVAVG